MHRPQARSPRSCAGGDWTAAINAAAYTAVDAAEAAVAEAFAANALGPAILAEETRRRGVPLIHISTDYVFDGAKPAPYVEDDRNPSAWRLRRKQARRRGGGEDRQSAAPHRADILALRPVRQEFRQDDAEDSQPSGESVRVVDDQHGTPTAAPDLAAALIRIATSPDLRDRAGTYHFANRGETTWCGFARRIFAQSAARGGPSAVVEAITTADYPTPARRPLNSRLSTERIERDFGIVPRAWEDALTDVVDTLLGAPPSPPPG